MRLCIFFALAFLTGSNLSAQESAYDAAAIKILDRMSDMIGDLSSSSYNLHTSEDVVNNYALIDALSNIISTIDTVNKIYLAS